MIGFDWRYRSINDAAIRYEEGTKAGFLGYTTLLERHPGIEKTAMFAVLQRCMHERCAEHIEREVVDPEGGSAWFELLVQPVPEGIFIFSHDITERKRVELALLEREQQFRLFMEHAPAALAMLDNDMRYLLVSRRWLTDYSLSATDVIGRSHYDLFPDLPEQWKAIHQRCLAGAVEQSDADPFPRADGSLDWVRWEIRPWRKLDGTIGGILILSEVITERKRAEEKIRKLHRTLGVLSDINQAIVRIRHLPSLFEKACAIAVEKGAFHVAWIGLFDPETKSVHPVAHGGISDNELEKLLFTLNRQPMIGALRAGERFICNDIQNDPMWLLWREDASRLGCRSTVTLPLIIAGEIRGTFNLHAGEIDFFDEQEMRLMEEMAMDISHAMGVAEQDAQRLQAEADLRISEEKYRSLIESSESVIAVFDGQGTFLFANRVAAAGLGLTPETLTGCNMADVFPPPSAQGQLARIQQVIQTGEGAIYEAISVVLGEARWYRTSLQPIRDGSGQVTSVLVNTVDITRLKQAEAVLRSEKDNLEQAVAERTADLQAALVRVEAILHNSPDAILLVDADLTIQQTNPSFQTLFGTGWDEDLGQSLLTLFHPDDVHTISHLPQIAPAQQNGNQLEVRASRKDGTTFDAELTIGAIKGDGLICIIRDITERKAQERQLRYHASIQESVSDAVIAADMDFRIQSWNRTAELIYGWRATETIGQSVHEILQTTYASEDDGERILRDFFERGAWQGEVIQHHRDGRLIYIQASVNLFKDEMGRPIGLVSVNRDMTERKRAAEALQKSTAEIHDLYNHAPCGYHSIDQDGLIVQINDTELHWLGYTRAEVIGRLKVTALLTPESVLLFQQAPNVN